MSSRLLITCPVDLQELVVIGTLFIAWVHNGFNLKSPIPPTLYGSMNKLECRSSRTKFSLYIKLTSFRAFEDQSKIYD